MNRRDAIKGLAGITIGTASCVLLPAKERAGKPEKLEPGQVWKRTHDRGPSIVTRTTDNMVALRELMPGYFCADQWFFRSELQEDWFTYLGNIRDLGGKE